VADRLPQYTDVIWKRLTRIAKELDSKASAASQAGHVDEAIRWRARANTCLQAAGRLRAYFHEYGEHQDASHA
jgi:hypothetical protein